MCGNRVNKTKLEAAANPIGLYILVKTDKLLNFTIKLIIQMINDVFYKKN